MPRRIGSLNDAVLRPFEPRVNARACGATLYGMKWQIRKSISTHLGRVYVKMNTKAQRRKGSY
jgi:hypothetical protein